MVPVKEIGLMKPAYILIFVYGFIGGALVEAFVRSGRVSPMAIAFWATGAVFGIFFLATPDKKDPST